MTASDTCSISVNTLAFHGYGLPRAFEQISAMGFAYVEPALISRYNPEMNSEYFSQKKAEEMRRLILGCGLRVIAVSAHMDLGLKSSIEAFRKRMDFACVLGASYIHTNGTGLESYSSFMSNLEHLLPAAEANGLVITLENPGDGEPNVVGSGEEGAALVFRIGSDNLRLNYDFSNAYSYSKGEADINADFQRAAPFVAHLHLKDMRQDGDGWSFVPIGTGITGYPSIFRLILHQKVFAPMSIELPLHFRRDNDYALRFERRARPTEQEIGSALIISRDYVMRQLSNRSEHTLG